jgi:hypothetical protein
MKDLSDKEIEDYWNKGKKWKLYYAYY